MKIVGKSIDEGPTQVYPLINVALNNKCFVTDRIEKITFINIIMLIYFKTLQTSYIIFMIPIMLR